MLLKSSETYEKEVNKYGSKIVFTTNLLNSFLHTFEMTLRKKNQCKPRIIFSRLILKTFSFLEYSETHCLIGIRLFHPPPLSPFQPPVPGHFRLIPEDLVVLARYCTNVSESGSLFYPTCNIKIVEGFFEKICKS